MIRLGTSPLAVLLASTLLATPGRSALPMARLNSILPSGVQRGASVEVVLDGADLDDVESLYFSRAGVSAERLEGLRFRITAAPDVPLGPIDVRAVGAWGVSNPRTFTVGSLAEAAELEPNNFPEQAQRLPVDSVVNGVVAARADVDYYVVALEQGQTVVVDCEGERIDSLLDAVLTIFAPDGRALDLSDRYAGRDARIDFTAPAAGDYRIRVHDLVYDGGAAYFYRLAVHGRPVVSYLFPPAVNPGATTEVRVVGRNLPNSQLNESVTVKNRPMEETAATVSPANAAGLEPDVFLHPRSAGVDGFAFRGDSSPPIVAGLTELPVVLEQEPNDAEHEAQSVAAPVEIAGRLDRKGDRDCFRFAAKAGQTIEIEGISEQAGFPADLTLFVRRIRGVDAAAGQLQTEDVGEFDDSLESVGGLAYVTSTHDPLARFQAPEDSEYLVEVRDRFSESRGDGRFVYRLKIHSPTPDFRLLAAPADGSNPSSILARRGGATHATVYALRKGGFSGEIRVHVEGLPDGVSAPPVTIGPAVSQAPIVFHAAPDAPDFTGEISVVGTARIGDADVERKARTASILWPAGGNAPRPARLTRSVCLAVRGDAPYLLSAQPSDSKIGQGAQVLVPVKLNRRWADFTDKLVGLSAQFLPPNVDNPAVEIPAGADEGLLSLYFKPDAPPGSYTFILQGAANVPFTKTPNDPEAKKNPVEVADPSLPIEITIVPRPIEITLDPANPTLRPGQSANLKVAVNRHNGYNGPVRLSLTLPAGLAGLASPEITVPADVAQTVLPVQAASDLPVGDKGGLTVRGLADFGGELVPVDARLQVKIEN